MGGRPKDWHPVADKDPVPGDPERVATLGKKLRQTADVIEQQIKNLKAVADVTAWDSDAGREFRKTAEGTVGKLEAAFKRYDAAADAFGTAVGDEHTQNYASQLDRAQKKADAALKDAQEADGRKSTAQKNLDDLTGSKHDKSKKRGYEDSLDTANQDIEHAKGRVDDAKKIRDDAAKKAREAIRNIIEHDSLKDKESFWGSLLAKVNDVMGTVAAVCGIASLLVGWIPIVGQALAGVLGTIAMLASLVSMLCTAIQWARGEADAWDVGFAVLGFAMMGVGKAFTKVAGKFGGRAIPALTKAGRNSRVGQVGRAARRAKKQVGKVANSSMRPSAEEIGQSFKEPFSEIFSRKGWKEFGSNIKSAFKPSDWRAAGTAIQSNGGLAKSFSVVDASVASDLKAAKNMVGGLGHIPAVNQISSRISQLTGTGVTLTGANLALDDQVIEWTHLPDWKGKIKSIFD